MGYGIRVKNVGGQIQLDGEYKNLTIHSSSSLTIPALSVYPAWTSTVDITNVPIASVPFFRPLTSEYLNIQGFVFSGNEIDKLGIFRDDNAAEGATLYYRFYYLGALTSLPTGSYGMRVFNSSGTEIFNSGNSLLRLYTHTATLNYSIDPDSYNYTDVTVSDADNNYFLMTPYNWCCANNGGASNSTYCWTALKKINSTTIRIAQVPTWMEEITTLSDYTKWHSSITLLEAIA